MANELSISYTPAQDKIFTSTKKHKVLVKGRRFGFTDGLSRFLTESLVTGKYRKILWGDTTLGNLRRYWDRYWLPMWKTIPESLWNFDKVNHQLTYRDSYVDFRSADRPDNWEGFGYDIVVLNEAGIILQDESLYYNSVLPMTLDFDADTIIGGTPKGAGSLFEKLADDAKADDNSQYFHYTSYDNPIIKKGVIDKLASTMPELVRKQEIFGEFISNAGVVFRNIEDCAGASMTEPEQGETYYIGLDLGKKEDYTVIKVMDAQRREVYHDRFKDMEWTLLIERVKIVQNRYNNALVLVDATGMGGDVVLENMREADIKVEGFIYTPSSKNNLIRNLILGFEEKKLKILDDPDTKRELKNFQYRITSTGHFQYGVQSGHDDCVNALALVYWLAKEVSQPRIRILEEDTPERETGEHKPTTNPFSRDIFKKKTFRGIGSNSFKGIGSL